MNRKAKPAPRPARTYFWWQKLLFGLVPSLLLLGLLGVVEVALRARDSGIAATPFSAAPGDASLRVDNLDFVFKYHPQSRASRQDVLRNLFAADKPAGTLRGIVLGGSTAEGFPYHSNHGFSGILQEALREATGRKVEVLNLGFSAMSSYYVRDVARKIADQDWDFVVIYSGHNEYYGTISAASGSNHLAKLVNMRLKDSRLGQAFYNKLAPDTPAGAPTLMTRQFDQTRFVPEDERDAEIAARFVENIGAAVARLADTGTAVLVVEPVSNLVDMPPFVGRGDAGLDSELVQQARQVMAGDSAALEAWLARSDLAQRAASDPLVAFVQARIAQAAGNFDTAGFVRARDLDPAPFRARSGLVKALADWTQASDQASWVALSDFLQQRLGPAALSHQVFIDHLHFNHAGQVLTAEAIATQLAQDRPALGIDSARLQAWFQDPQAVDAALDFLQIYDLLASRRVAALVAGPPYRDMALAYRSPGSRAGLDAAALADPQLRRQLAQVPEGDMLMAYASAQVQGGHTAEFVRFLASFERVNPGSPKTWLAKAGYLVGLKTAETDSEAIKAYNLATKLADDPQRQYALARSQLVGKGRSDLVSRLEAAP